MLKVKRLQKHKKIRKKLNGSGVRPRLSVFRSNQHIYAQIIDDNQGITLVAGSDSAVQTGSKKQKALNLGSEIAKKALQKNIKTIVFDRGGFKFHGRVAALAEGLRKGGLEF